MPTKKKDALVTSSGKRNRIYTFKGTRIMVAFSENFNVRIPGQVVHADDEMTASSLTHLIGVQHLIYRDSKGIWHGWSTDPGYIRLVQPINSSVKTMFNQFVIKERMLRTGQGL